jgi:hypothetical protein
METNINALLDQAIEKLPLVRRMLYKRLVKNEEARRDVCAVLIHKLQADSNAMALLPNMSLDSFTATTPFTIDPDKLAKFLEILVKYLPMILDIIFKFFVSVLLLCLIPLA